MVLSATPVLPTGPMTISGYAWGHIVASGPRQLGRDTRVIDTHPRPLYRRKKHVTVKRRRWMPQQLSARVSVVASLRRQHLHPFYLKQLTAFPKTQGKGRYLSGDRQPG